MVNFSSRQVNLIEKLIDCEKVTVKGYAELYSVSNRTIYRELDKINNCLEEYNIKILNTPSGLIMKGNLEHITNLKLSLPNFKNTIKAKARQNLILMELLQFNKEPIKIQYFANKFNVSPAAISHQLKDIKAWFSNENIKFISKPGVGICIESSESNIRHALVDLLYKNYNIDQFISFIGNDCNNSLNKNDKRTDELYKRLKNVIDYNTITLIEKVLNKLENTQHYQILDRLYIELAIHLSLAIKRLENNEEIKLDKPVLEKLKKYKEYELAKTIAVYIEQEINIAIPEDEIGYITIHLQEAKSSSELLNVDKNKVYSLCTRIIRSASKIFQIDFNTDSVLKHDLRQHLLYSINRFKSGYSIRNPIIDDIKKQYSDEFDKCNEVMNIIRKNLNTEISDDEIGYITMHFAAAIERMKVSTENKIYNVLVTCASGIGASRMLLSKLEKIPDLNIIAAASILKIDEYINKHKIDLIISTVPIRRNDIRIIVVNPLFTENDSKLLEKELNIKIPVNYEAEVNTLDNQAENANDIYSYSLEITSIIKNALCTNIDSVSSSEDLVQKLLNEIINKNIINASEGVNIKSILLYREKLGTLVLPHKNFVIYHCVSENIKNTIIVLGKLKSPINLINLLNKYEKIYNAFLIIAPKDKKNSLEVIGDLAAGMIKDMNFINKLNDCSGLDDFKMILKEMLLKNLYLQASRIFN